MENDKYKVENYKTKRRVKVPDSEHIVVKNTHEAIISEETFETVQTVLNARHYPAHHEHENLFKSILFCEYGKRMAIAHKVRNNKKKHSINVQITKIILINVLDQILFNITK